MLRVAIAGSRLASGVSLFSSENSLLPERARSDVVEFLIRRIASIVQRCSKIPMLSCSSSTRGDFGLSRGPRAEPDLGWTRRCWRPAGLSKSNTMIVVLVLEIGWSWRICSPDLQLNRGTL